MRLTPFITKTILLFACCLCVNTMMAQENTFERISREVAAYKPDTSAVPNDKTTAVIRQLRSLRGGFNINEALDFKIQEEISKNPAQKAELEKMAGQFKTGKGMQWLDNAIIWIYRNHFTYKELKQLVKFYKTTAGQKLATASPVIMLQSLAAGQLIQEALTKGVEKK